MLATWFHWTGEVLAMPTFLAAPHVRHPAARLRALRANPGVAVTIDTETFPPEVLTIRGRVTISEVEGIPPEYASAARRYLGDEAAREYLVEIDQPGTRMARIDLRPTWVGVLDFQTRLPSALGGISYDLLSDFHPKGQVAAAYGVMRDDGMADRAIFIVDKHGKIIWAKRYEIPEQPDPEELFKVLGPIP